MEDEKNLNLVEHLQSIFDVLEHILVAQMDQTELIADLLKNNAEMQKKIDELAKK